MTILTSNNHNATLHLGGLYDPRQQSLIEFKQKNTTWPRTKEIHFEFVEEEMTLHAPEKWRVAYELFIGRTNKVSNTRL